MDSTVHVAGDPPARGDRVARALWYRSVRSRELLRRAAPWPDVASALGGSDDLELLLALLAIVGAPMRAAAPTSMLVVTRTGADLVAQLDRELCASATWLEEDRRTFALCLAGAAAPDVDSHQLGSMRAEAITRAGRTGRGEHRYRLLTSASLVASLGLQRERRPVNAVADSAMLGELLVGLAHDACSTADLFARGPTGYLEWGCSLVRDRFEVLRAA